MQYQNRLMELCVGLFMLLAMAALVMLALKVSGLTHQGLGQHYQLTAEFDNIGGLKLRAPVTLAGVTIGRVTRISLDKDSYKAKVTLMINRQDQGLPTDTSASILTQGLLGANYIALTPGFEDGHLKDGDSIERTQSALILEKLIGQFLFNLKNDKASGKPDSKEANTADHALSATEPAKNGSVLNQVIDKVADKEKDKIASKAADKAIDKVDDKVADKIVTKTIDKDNDQFIDQSIDEQMSQQSNQNRR